MAQGLIISSSYNIFTVKSLEDNECCQCGIKGKVLKLKEKYYNPLAPGDIVEYENNQIINVKERRSAFTRLNTKANLPQLIAANIDMIVCITTPVSPPFRPRFIDRVLLEAEYSGVESLVLMNKIELLQNLDGGVRNEIEIRMNDFKKSGYNVHCVSAVTNEGIDELRGILKSKLAVFTGQSGVGKSSLINILLPGAAQKTDMLNEKYDRGCHTTTRAILLEGEQFSIIDTPGVRQILVSGIHKNDIAFYMKEFAPLAKQCAFGASCTHTNEKGCKILEALKSGSIHPDRYESYLRQVAPARGLGLGSGDWGLRQSPSLPPFWELGVGNGALRELF